MERISRISKDEYYLRIALAVSKRSTCLKRHYGCVIVKMMRSLRLAITVHQEGKQIAATLDYAKE